MATGESARSVLKRLRKVESAQRRLAELAGRVRIQADAVAELLKLANGLVADEPPPSRKPVARTAAAPRGKRAAAKSAAGPARKAAPAARKPAPKATATRQAAPAARTAAPAARKAAPKARKAAPAARKAAPAARKPAPATRKAAPASRQGASTPAAQPVPDVVASPLLTPGSVV